MRACGWPSLAILLVLVGPAEAREVTVYRCTDAQGRVTLQDAPCPAGQAQQQRRMQRPVDPPPRATPSPATATVAPRTPVTPLPGPEPVLRTEPPPLWQCTSHDGEVRYSENYDPNPRCVPLAVLGYDAGAFGATCRWVEDSCVRLSNAAACEQYAHKLEQAESDALHAFSDTQAYHDSEVKRLTQIVRGSCR